MKLSRLFAWLLPAVMLCACNPDESVIAPHTDDDNIRIENTGNAYSRALDNAFDIMREVYPEKHKSLVGRKHLLKPEYYTTATLATARPQAVKMMSGKAVCENNPPLDTLLYIVNFGNDEGFAVMFAGDNNGNDILALTERGSLTIDDLTRDYSDGPEGICAVTPGATMAGLINNGAWTIIDGSKPPMGDDSWDFSTLKPQYYIYGPWENDGPIVNPLVKVKLRQGYPFNKYCPIRGDDKAPAGCVAIALLQIMSVHQYPSTINGYTGNWNHVLQNWNNTKNNPEMNKAQDILAHWAREIGRQCNMVYGEKGSSAFDISAKSCLGKYSRYKNLDIKKDVTLDNVEGMIKSGWPVYCSGYDKKHDKGHAWVLDGLYRQKRLRKKLIDGNYIPDGYVYRTPFVHCNFGWGGTCDGYYFVDCFNLYNGALVIAPDDSSDSHRDRYYEYNTQVITYKFN